MRHKKIGCYSVGLITVAIIGVVISVLVLKQYERQTSEKSFLEPFREVYAALREKFPSIKSFEGNLGAGGHYCMYYIECDIDENTDCFAEFVDIQREINAHLEDGKADEWFNDFTGHIEIIAGSRKLRAFYHHGSISREFWADDIISDEYSVLWDAFPEVDEIYLAISLTDYSDEIRSAILQKNKGRNITVEPQFGS